MNKIIEIIKERKQGEKYTWQVREQLANEAVFQKKYNLAEALNNGDNEKIKHFLFRYFNEKSRVCDFDLKKWALSQNWNARKPKYLPTYCPCPIKVFGKTRASILPTNGITTTSDNTVDWDNFTDWCKRTGYTKSEIESFSEGNFNELYFEPEGEGLAPIGVQPPNAPTQYRPLWHDWYIPTHWIFEGNE